MKMLCKCKIMRFLYCIIMVICCACFFTGCRYQLPLFIADDSSVMDRLQFGLTHMDAMSGDISYAMTRTSGDQKIISSVTGPFCGSMSDKMEFSYESVDSLTESVSDNQANDILDCEIILDTPDNLLYSKKNKDWIAYSDAMSMVDMDWWISFFENESFGYDGKGSVSENTSSGYLVSGVFHGDMIDDILNHLHVDLGGSADTTDVEMGVKVCLDGRTGQPLDMLFFITDNGVSMQVLDDAGLVWEVNELNFHVAFDKIEKDSEFTINIPKEALTAKVVSPSADMIVEDNNTASKNAIVSPDNKWAVSFAEHKVFDKIDINKKKSMVVSSSAHVAGDPTITLSFVKDADAYNSVITDQQVALEYYNQEPALSEVYVSEKVTASTINSHSAYSYIQQYSDMSYGFANTDYCTYVDLGDNQYLSIKISSMVGLGVSNVLTEDYAQSILKNIEITAM